jgi:hypothetical protein
MVAPRLFTIAAIRCGKAQRAKRATSTPQPPLRDRNHHFDAATAFDRNLRANHSGKKGGDEFLDNTACD